MLRASDAAGAVWVTSRVLDERMTSDSNMGCAAGVDLPTASASGSLRPTPDAANAALATTTATTPTSQLDLTFIQAMLPAEIGAVKP